MEYYKFKSLNIKNGFFYKPYNFGTSLDNTDFSNNINMVINELDIKKISMVLQKHTDIIKKVTLENCDDIIEADGMVTNIPNIGLGTKVADCQAILLYDPIKKVIGNIHSGWRGTVKKIVGNAIKIMVNDYNCSLNDIKVCICPSIMQDHFEVDEDVYDLFKNSFSNIDKYTIYKEETKKYYIDTLLLNKDYLISLGIKDDNIELSNICTMCDNKFYSYRYDKTTGRNLAVIAL